MILKVTNSQEEFGINTYKLSLFDFSQKEYHPFIATQEWDRVEIDLNEDTPKGIIRQLTQNIRVVPIFDKENITVKVMQLLCELLPDYSANLRSLYLKNKEGFNDFINEICISNGW